MALSRFDPSAVTYLIAVLAYSNIYMSIEQSTVSVNLEVYNQRSMGVVEHTRSQHFVSKGLVMRASHDKVRLAAMTV